MKSILCLLAALASLASPVRADHPRLGDASDLIESGDCAVEGPLARITGREAWSATAFGAALPCTAPGSPQAAAGLGGQSILIAPVSSVTGLGVGYGIGLLKSAGLSLDHGSGMVLAVFTRELSAGLLGHVNLGWSRSRSARQNCALWSLGFEPGSQRSFAADLSGDDRGRPWLSAGMGWSIADRLSVNLAGALQFEKPKLNNLSVGFKLVY